MLLLWAAHRYSIHEGIRDDLVAFKFFELQLRGGAAIAAEELDRFRIPLMLTDIAV